MTAALSYLIIGGVVWREEFFEQKTSGGQVMTRFSERTWKADVHLEVDDVPGS